MQRLALGRSPFGVAVGRWCALRMVTDVAVEALVGAQLELRARAAAVGASNEAREALVHLVGEDDEEAAQPTPRRLQV